MNTRKGKIAILLSGRGSNFEAIYKNSIRKDSLFEIAVVVSDKSKAKGLKTAGDLGIPTHFIRPRDFSSKDEYEKNLIELFETFKIDLICLAGFMRIISPTLIKKFPGRIINIHPSLLPLFPGLHAQKQALEAGAEISGCTVHFVDEGVDSGPVIMQASVGIEKDDSEESLSTRILIEEHRIYSEVIKLFFLNKLKIDGRTVKILT
ncbi:MAG: phosphoribosylglycinamide formyltransferase [Candidatus Aminicenantes bacterium]|nr:phosphoribosylglycinamide formyltransferase [Candidatus Aminicenantes bacterium]MCK5005138.1 phosphoribosylglycinamide formyltransferase [Candidatus Aminicenantes bacterium]